MSKPLRVINLVALIMTIAINYLSNSGYFNGQTVASISARHPTLLTPAPYAFAIWAVIYLSLAAFVIYHLRSTPETQNGLRQVGWWFLYSCILNCCWVVAWVHEYIGWSVVIILLLLFSLFRIMYRTRMELTDPPVSTIFFLWWPFCLYLGWILLAAVVNIAVWMSGLPATSTRISAAAWSSVLLAVAAMAYLILTWRRNMREAAVVGVWGLVAVAMADRSRSPAISVLACVLAATLLISSAVHGYRNRKYSPFKRRSKADLIQRE